MMRLLTTLILLIVLANSALPQEAKDKDLQKAAESGKALRTLIPVSTNVTAQAVLIPRINARRIFGKEIADNYAVIEINIGNKSPDAALIIHGIFIDYSHWALSGANDSFSLDGMTRESTPFQATTHPDQVASEEARVVRGQLLNAQMYSKRNWTMRLLTLAGSLAAGYSFSIKEAGIVKGLGVFNGVFLPGAKEAWPDGTIDQINRLSDFGYQANKVIPKQGAEVIVCFFPIDRFLTPGFRKLFLKSPALFFAPLQMLVDPTLDHDVNQILKSIDDTIDSQDLRKQLRCYVQVVRDSRFGLNRTGNAFVDQMNENVREKCYGQFGMTRKRADDGIKWEVTDESKFKHFLVLDLISQMSLNSVTVKIDGVMTVDTTNITGKIDGVTLDDLSGCGASNMPCYWLDVGDDKGVRTGFISGSYLTNGSVEIAEAADLGITNITIIPEGSSDQVLHFSFKLTKPIKPADTKLTFTVTKPAGTGTAKIKSNAWVLSVGFTPLAPRVTDLTQDQEKKILTIKGSGFNNVPLVVTLRSPDGTDKEVKPEEPTSATELKIKIPDNLEPAGCWKVLISANGLHIPVADRKQFLVSPNPTLTSAKKKEAEISLTGTDLVDAAECDAPVTYQLVKEQPAATDNPLPLAMASAESPKKVNLKLPPEANTGSWKVQVFLKGTKKAEVKLE